MHEAQMSACPSLFGLVVVAMQPLTCSRTMPGPESAEFDGPDHRLC